MIWQNNNNIPPVLILRKDMKLVTYDDKIPHKFMSAAFTDEVRETFTGSKSDFPGGVVSIETGLDTHEKILMFYNNNISDGELNEIGSKIAKCDVYADNLIFVAEFAFDKKRVSQTMPLATIQIGVTMLVEQYSDYRVVDKNAPKKQIKISPKFDIASVKYVTGFNDNGEAEGYSVDAVDKDLSGLDDFWQTHFVDSFTEAFVATGVMKFDRFGKMTGRRTFQFITSNHIIEYTPDNGNVEFYSWCPDKVALMRYDKESQAILDDHTLGKKESQELISKLQNNFLAN